MYACVGLLHDLLVTGPLLHAAVSSSQESVNFAVSFIRWLFQVCCHALWQTWIQAELLRVKLRVGSTRKTY